MPLKELIKSEEARWLADKAQRLLYEHPLNEYSQVVEAGGYYGDWAQQLVDRYDPFIQVYEPVKRHQEMLAIRFELNKKVRVSPVGLYNDTTIAEINLDYENSSLYRRSRETEQITLVDAVGVLPGKIDLLSLSCEGAEFVVLPRLISSAAIINCHRVQIQFNDLFADSWEKREKIRDGLSRTHRQLWSYDFVWELWERRFSEDLDSGGDVSQVPRSRRAAKTHVGA